MRKERLAVAYAPEPGPARGILIRTPDYVWGDVEQLPDRQRTSDEQATTSTPQTEEVNP